MSKDYIELIHNTFSTLIFDAIQYFPENVKKVHYESSGLLFGVTNGEHVECDYVFPVGSVGKRTKSSIKSNPKIDLAIKSSRQLFSTSTFIGTYHSHPYEIYFPEWACPSNADVLYSCGTKYPYEIIIAIARDGMEDKPLTINFLEDDGYEFFVNPDADKDNNFPKVKKLGYMTSFIAGEFQKYSFEIRAYQFTGDALKDIDLESSEAELLSMLNEEKLRLQDISENHIYSLRKLEFNLRTQQYKQKSDDNIQYHLSKLKSAAKLIKK